MQLKSAGQQAMWDLGQLSQQKTIAVRNGNSGTITYNTGANTTCTNTLRGILGGTQAELTQ